MREEVEELKKELNEVKEHSWATEVLHDYKAANKRQFIIIIIILAMWFATIGYLVYTLNDIGTIETIQEVEDVDTIGGNVVNNGDVYGEN